MSRDILQSIIDDFQVDGFNRFFRAKNRSFAPRIEELEQYDDDSFRSSLKLGEIEYSNEGQQLVVCTLESLKPLSERLGKKAQYAKGKKILMQLQADAGIFVFYDSNGNFRFSLIYANYLGKKRDWSTFRRFTYFVSPKLTNKTFLQQIGDGDLSSLEKIKKAFSVEKVTKDFYKDIANWYFWAVQNSKFPKNAEAEENGRNIAVIRLITRLIFIWFMRERGLVANKLFDITIIKDYLKDISPEQSTYYKAVLQNLFFATLSTKKEERQFRSETRGHKGYNPDFGNQYVYRYHQYFKNPDKIKNYFGDIPFLNGGLFECLDDKQKRIYIDGFTSTKKNQPEVPNFLFFSNEEDADLNTEYGTKNKKYKVRGLLDTLSSYNFTIDENDPNDAEIALDPELLGKVFENLLASFNPETASTARKATGSYYTPREIVDYMVIQSLKEYIKTNLKDFSDLDNRTDQLFDSEVAENPFSSPESNKIVKLIDNLRIVDPAVGSGAFPMGILNKLVFLLGKLDPQNKLWKEAQVDAVKKSISDPTLKRKLIEQICEQFKNKNFDYGRKLYLIQKCIYGVDIQQIAVEIAKLRFFIALLVDEKIDKGQKNWGIEPLPNLDFKIMQGNSLISEFMDINFDNDNNLENGKFNLTDTADEFITEFQQKKSEFQNEPDKAKKDKLKQKIDDLMIKIFESKLKKHKRDYFRKLKAIDTKYSALPDQNQRDKIITNEKRILSNKEGFDLEKFELQLREFSGINRTKPFFAWRLYFAEVFRGDNPGFDIAIANPPYIRQELLKESKPIFKRNFKVFNSTSDLYTYFYELSFNLIRRGGVSTFITNNSWIRSKYGERLRELLLENTEILGINNFEDERKFDTAIVESNILIFSKTVPSREHKITYSIGIPTENNKIIIPQEILESKGFILEKPVALNIRKKIEKSGKKLKDWNVFINRGILTGLNKAFYIDSKTRERFLRIDPKCSKFIVPLLRGKDIKRYNIIKNQIWLINSHNGVKSKNIPRIDLRNNHPVVFKHLNQWKKELKIRRDQGKDWTNLRNCAFLNEFNKDKIVWITLSDRANFAYDDKHYFTNDSTFFISKLCHIIYISYTVDLRANII